MKKRIVLQDDRDRRIRTFAVTDAARLEMAKRGQPIPDGITVLPLLDNQGHKILDFVKRNIVYEGEALIVAVKRAKRWYRKMKHGPWVTMPNHIAQAMLAYQLADPKGFKAEITGTLARA